MNKLFISLVLLTSFLTLGLTMIPVNANHGHTVSGTGEGGTTVTGTAGNNPGTGGQASKKLTNPLGEGTTPQTLIGRVINALLGVVGSLALIMFIYGGVMWMTAAGNSERASKAQKILLWATIGLVIIFASYSIVNFLINTAILGTPAEIPTTQ